MTDSLNSDDDEEGNQRRFAFSFVMISCHTMAGLGIQIIHHGVLRFLLLVHDSIPEIDRLTAFNSGLNGSPQEHGEMMSR
jgi:hypothetical protein